MVVLGEVIEGLRTTEDNNSGHGDQDGPVFRGSRRRKWSRKRRNSGGLQGSPQPSLNGQGCEERGGANGRDVEEIQQQADARVQGIPLTQEDHQARFYTYYRKVADEYDKEFLDKYDEDLNTTLIFAGLFSAVTSAFIVEVDSQLQPNPGEETAALLRVLVYQNDNTAFGGDVPTLPQWTGPPPTMVHVQAILFASLAVSLLSAFLAMLGKQWLNRYASSDMRGSAVERSQNRQRKLDGIVAWYFDHVMESLPLMLQAALLLLGCALARYLWEISVTVASVIIGVTSLGLVFYLFFIVAGTVSESCPYQTPGSLILRHLGPKVWRAIHSTPSSIGSVRSAIPSVLRNAFEKSQVIRIAVENARRYHPWWSRREIVPFFGKLVLKVPLGFAVDVYHLGRATIRVLFTLVVGAYHLVYSRFHNAYSTLKRRLCQPTAPPGFRCVSWTLQTSLDKSIRLTASEHLATMTEFTGLDSTLVTDCFNVFVGCVSLNNDTLVVIQGLEQLATASVRCLFRTFHHLRVTDPTFSVLADILRRYNRAFPFKTDFSGLPFHHTIMMIHALAHGSWDHCNPQWHDFKPSAQEHIPFAHHVVEVAQMEYDRIQHKKVPRWILRFALHSLSLDPPSPPSVVADCLTIAAIDLGCDVPKIVTLSPSARVEQVSSLIIQKLEVSTQNAFFLISHRKTIATLFPYAVRLEQSGRQEMLDAILRAAGAEDSVLTWPHIGTHITALFDTSSPPTLNRAITFAAPCIPWYRDELNAKNTVARWAAAALEVPYSEEVGQSVVDTLLRVSCYDTLLPHIPVDIWALLKKRPSLPPVCQGRSFGSQGRIVGHVRGLGDIEILKSYLLLVWSEWDTPQVDGFAAMQVSIREDFDGIGMWGHLVDLVEHLDYTLGRLDRRLECLEQDQRRTDGRHIRWRKEKYEHLKNVLLLEVDKITRTLTRSHMAFTCALPLPQP